MFNKVERACKKIYMNNGLTAPGRRVKLWAPPTGGAHFDGVKEGLHELLDDAGGKRHMVGKEILIRINMLGYKGPQMGLPSVKMPFTVDPRLSSRSGMRGLVPRMPGDH